MECKICGIPTLKDLCPECRAALGNRKHNKPNAVAVTNYLNDITEGNLDYGDRKLDVYRAKNYQITRQKMYEIFKLGCKYCRDRHDNWTELTILFNRFKTPTAICKQCCDRKYGKGVWTKSILGKVNTDKL